MCYSTLVLDKAYAALPGVEYYTVETGLGTFSFAQAPRGVVPSLLEDLAQLRKRAKRDMAEAEARGDSWARALANGRQMAMKVTMNSVYGFAGATRGMMPMVPIAASVTATGREMIRKTKEMAESLVPGSRVVYGDSVAAHTPVVVRRGPGTERVAAIEDLCAAWRPAHGGKETGEFDGEVWSDRGWTRVLAVVRHRAGKPLVRVATPTGIVDVTTDHSLLRPDATPVTPAELCVGDALLHAPLPRVGVGHAAELSTPSQVAAAGAALPAAALGLPSVAAFRVSVRHPGPAPTAVLSASRVAYPADAYVYDLTTANHHFAAGVGSLVVHNTDSVMVVFDVGEARRHDVAAHFEVAQRVARDITATFAPPNELEHEKCYNPYLLFSKKRYAGEFFFRGTGV